MSAHRLSDTLWMLRLGTFQAYLWRDAQGATLIDSGPVDATNELTTSLGEVGLRPGDLDRVVLTHFHDDHAGGARYLSDKGVPIVAHTADVPFVDGSAPRPAPNFTPEERQLHAVVAAGLNPAPPVAVDRAVNDGDDLPIGAGAVVVGTPGHTDGSMAVFLPRERVLFTGDTAAEHQGEVILGVFNLDREQTAASFARLAELDAAIVCFGHGEPLTDDARVAFSSAAARLVGT